MKTKYIEAIKNVITLYKTDTWSGKAYNCPLCLLVTEEFYTVLLQNCDSCILKEFTDKLATEKVAFSRRCCNCLTYPTSENYFMRIKFWEEVLKLIEPISNEDFKNFDYKQLIEIDKKVYESDKK